MKLCVLKNNGREVHSTAYSYKGYKFSVTCDTVGESISYAYKWQLDAKLGWEVYYNEGRAAKLAGEGKESCPHGKSELMRRCAWLGAWNDY